MGRQLNKLTALKVKNLKFEDSSSNKHTDGAGLYLYTHKNGSKYWRMDYTSPITSKRNTLALGVYPTITLEAARKRRDEVRQQIANNIDPAEMREQVKQQAKANAKNSFRHIAEQWIEAIALQNCLSILKVFDSYFLSTSHKPYLKLIA